MNKYDPRYCYLLPPPAAKSRVSSKCEAAAILRYMFCLTLRRIGQILRVSHERARCLILNHDHRILFCWRRAAQIEAMLIAREWVYYGDAQAMFEICSSIVTVTVDQEKSDG